jgi:hypothetical protein
MAPVMANDSALVMPPVTLRLPPVTLRFPYPFDGVRLVDARRVRLVDARRVRLVDARRDVFGRPFDLFGFLTRHVLFVIYERQLNCFSMRLAFNT